MHREDSVALTPVLVDKPWGREVWYSGVEARGESRVQLDDAEVPLSRYLAAHGRDEPVTLLKALQPTIGDLYMEVHEAKWEVYIVDAVDAALWPCGGCMLLGVDQRRRRALGDAGLRSSLLAVAQAAERRDTALEDVEAFLNRVPLQPGDALTIPPGVPHSLRRGIDVIEFQTPAFERRILAASQPVVTQNGWDCAAAVAAMDIASQVKVERVDTHREVAATPGFRILHIGAGAAATVPPWTVGWVQRGEIDAGGRRFAARTAFLTSTETTVSASPDAVALAAVEAAPTSARSR